MPTGPRPSLSQNLSKLKEINLIKSTIKKFYAQASKINIKDIIYIKNMFLTLTPKKIVEVNNIINKSSMVKPKIKMTTKGPLKKQVIILMSESNSNIIKSNVVKIEEGKLDLFYFSFHFYFIFSFLFLE